MYRQLPWQFVFKKRKKKKKSHDKKVRFQFQNVGEEIKTQRGMTAVWSFLSPTPHLETRVIKPKRSPSTNEQSHPLACEKVKIVQ